MFADIESLFDRGELLDKYLQELAIKEAGEERFDDWANRVLTFREHCDITSAQLLAGLMVAYKIERIPTFVIPNTKYGIAALLTLIEVRTQ